MCCNLDASGSVDNNEMSSDDNATVIADGELFDDLPDLSDSIVEE